MGKEKIRAIGLLVVMAILLIAVNTALIIPGTAQVAEWHVYPGDSVQAAVNSAEDGDIIYLHPGYFMGGNEKIHLNKCVTIIRAGESFQLEAGEERNPAGDAMAPLGAGDPSVFVIPASTEWTSITIQKTESSNSTPRVDVPVLTPLGVMALIGLLSIVVAVSIKKRR